MKNVIFISLLALGVAACGGGGGGIDDPSIPLRVNGSITVDGLVRTYTLNLPPTYAAGSAFPLIIALHGGGGSSEQFESTSLLTPKAQAAQFAVVYPNGTKPPTGVSARTWNAGGCCAYAMDQNINDVNFIRQLIIELTARYKLNPKRIYATGHSNGAFMSYRLACELSDRIAAIAPSAGAMLLPACTPSRPVPVLHAHSRLDTNVPYLGGLGTGPGSPGLVWPSTQNTLDRWATLDSCPAAQTSAAPGYTFTKWSSCAGGSSIEFYLSDDGGHAWPGGLPGGVIGDTPTQRFNMNDLLLAFFSRYSMP